MIYMMKKFFLSLGEAVTEGVLFFTIFGVLIFSWDKTAQGILFEKFLLFGAGVLLLGLFVLIRGFFVGHIQLTRIPVGGLLGLIVGVFGVSTFFSDDVRRSVWGLFSDPFLGFLATAELCLFAFLVASIYSDRLFRVITFAFIGSNALISFSLLGILPQMQMVYSPATLFAILLVGIFFSITILSVQKVNGFFRGVAQKSWTLILFLILGVSLLSVERIMNDIFWWSVVLGFGVFLLFAIAGKVTFSSKSTWAIVGVVIFFSLRFLTGGTAPLSQETSPDRNIFWDVAKDSFFEKPLFGYGPSMYSRAYSLNMPKEVVQTPFLGKNFSVGTGGLWEWISTIGAVGTLAFLLLIVGYMGIVWYALKEEDHASNRDLLGLFSASIGLLPILIYVEYNGVLLFLFFLLIGGIFGVLSHRATWRDSQIRYIRLRWDPRYLPGVVLVVVFLFGLVGALVIHMGNVLRAGLFAYQAESATDIQTVVDSLGRAQKLDSKEAEYARRLGVIYGALAREESLKEEPDLAKMEDQYNRAFSSAVEATRLAPKDIVMIESLARVYESASTSIPLALDMAIDQYVLLEQMSPNNPIYSFKQGALLLRSVQENTKLDEEAKKKRRQESDEALSRAIVSGGNFSAAYYQLALLHRDRKEHDEAVWNALQAVEFSPYDATSILLVVSLYLEDPTKWNEVGDLLNRAEAINPNDPALHLYFGRWFNEKGRIDEARWSYQHASSLLGENQKEIQEYIENLIQGLDT